MSGGVAHANPDFALVEAGGRAGEVIHFSITGARGPVTYDLEIGPHDVVEDAVGAGNVVIGEFTLPHFGDSGRSLTVRAEIRTPGEKKKTTVTRKLRYLGPQSAVSQPTPSPPEPAVQPAPVQAPASTPVPSLPAVLSPEPVHTMKDAVPSARRSTPATRRKRRAARKRSHAKTRMGSPSGSGGAKARHHTKHRKTRAKGPGPRTAPLFDGVPEHGAGRDAAGKKRTGPSEADITSAQTPADGRKPSRGGGGLTAAILVPGLMGVAAMVLTGTTLHRRRRLR